MNINSIIMIKVGIIGGAGYTAGELLRLLIHHPLVEIKSIQSKSHSDQLVTAVHRDLLGETDFRCQKSHVGLRYPFLQVFMIFRCVTYTPY